MPQVTLIMTASIDGYVVKPDGMPVGTMPGIGTVARKSRGVRNVTPVGDS